MTFWQTKSLDELSPEEWEALCDGCGRCCLHKLEDEDSGDIALTRVACRLLDIKSCRCSNYAQRFQYVPDCLDLRKQKVSDLTWLPKTCAYRLIDEGLPLPDWHPLFSGNSHAIQTSGVSVANFAVSETDVDDFEDFIIDWLN